MTKHVRARRKLPREILGLLGVCALISFVLMQVLILGGTAIAESVLFSQDVTLTTQEYLRLDGWIFNLALLVTTGFFVILFLFLLGERLSYIRDILQGINALQSGQEDHVVPVEGSNELTQLAESVNYLSRTQREIKAKKRALAEEKDQFIRALSHDVRTPLTSIMAYSQLLSDGQERTPEEEAKYLQLIQNKAAQIKEMTDLLLDGSKRNLERFEDARLLMEQLADEFQASLEDSFAVQVDVSYPTRPATFDIQELFRVFDNLSSNVQKYADPSVPVKLAVFQQEDQLVIRQENAVRPLQEPAEGYQIGLRSIQRIARNYAGSMETSCSNGLFAITIVLSDI